ncbi:methyltransferase RsmF C-terminal domain-like protein [Thermococcus sp.]
MTENPREEVGKTNDTELVRKLLIEGYGYAPELIYEIRGNHQKVYAYRPCQLKISDTGRRGIYFGRIESDGIRLTIEGAFLVGPKATKNVLELDDEKARRYLAGESVEVNGDVNGWVILRWRSYYLGSAKAKNGRLLNYVPKERRLRQG